jgi:hypothetical protein
MNGDWKNTRGRAWRRETSGFRHGLLILCAAGLTILPAPAQTTRTWTGAISTDWFNPNFSNIPI